MLRSDHQHLVVAARDSVLRETVATVATGELQVVPEPRGADEIADEGASNWALAPDATTSPEPIGPGPDAGVDPDEGGIHWHEQPETGLAEGRGRADDDPIESAEVS